MLAARNGKRVLLLVGITGDLAGRYHAGKIAKDLAGIVGGKGGGGAEMAQAGGNMPENIEKMLARCGEII